MPNGGIIFTQPLAACEIFKHPEAGFQTWDFFQVIALQKLAPNQSYECRRALRALSDVGLLTIKLGPRGGLATATFEWTERAYLPPTLNLYEHDAIAEIAAGRY